MTKPPTHVIEIESGSGDPASIPLTLGEEMKPISVGKQGMWRLETSSGVDLHAFMYFDGTSLFVRSADDRAAPLLNGNRVGKDWSRVDVSSTIELGGTRLRFRKGGPGAPRPKVPVVDNAPTAAYAGGAPVKAPIPDYEDNVLTEAIAFNPNDFPPAVRPAAGVAADAPMAFPKAGRSLVTADGAENDDTETRVAQVDAAGMRIIAEAKGLPAPPRPAAGRPMDPRSEGNLKAPLARSRPPGGGMRALSAPLGNPRTPPPAAAELPPPSVPPAMHPPVSAREAPPSFQGGGMGQSGMGQGMGQSGMGMGPAPMQPPMSAAGMGAPGSMPPQAMGIGMDPTVGPFSGPMSGPMSGPLSGPLSAHPELAAQQQALAARERELAMQQQQIQQQQLAAQQQMAQAAQVIQAQQQQIQQLAAQQQMQANGFGEYPVTPSMMGAVTPSMMGAVTPSMMGAVTPSMMGATPSMMGMISPAMAYASAPPQMSEIPNEMAVPIPRGNAMTGPFMPPTPRSHALTGPVMPAAPIPRGHAMTGPFMPPVTPRSHAMTGPVVPHERMHAMTGPVMPHARMGAMTGPVMPHARMGAMTGPVMPPTRSMIGMPAPSSPPPPVGSLAYYTERYKALTPGKKLLVTLAPLCLLASGYLIFFDKAPAPPSARFGAADAGAAAATAPTAPSPPPTTVPPAPVVTPAPQQSCPPGFVPYPAAVAPGQPLPCVPAGTPMPAGTQAPPAIVTAPQQPPPPAQVAVAQPAAPGQPEPPPPPPTLERQAVDAVAQNDYPRAAQLYEQLLAQNPSNRVYAEAARILRAKTPPGARPPP